MLVRLKKDFEEIAQRIYEDRMETNQNHCGDGEFIKYTFTKLPEEFEVIVDNCDEFGDLVYKDDVSSEFIYADCVEVI